MAYKLVNKEKVSTTASILTLEAQDVSGYSDRFKDVWQRGIWNLQIKQPEIQIVRPYTPLPSPEASANEHTNPLRFLIRKEDHGEVSSYLHRLPIGSIIEARGPYVEYELPRNLNRIIFIAGGTGIAPALQTIHALFKGSNEVEQRKIHLIWANRKREDCMGGHSGAGQQTASTRDPTQQGVIVREINNLQQTYPGQITVEYLVDEEGSCLDQKALHRSLARLQKTHRSKDQGENGLILVSGPDGFIKHVAGSKLLLDEGNQQGEVGGLLAPDFATRYPKWTVWKI